MQDLRVFDVAGYAKICVGGFGVTVNALAPSGSRKRLKVLLYNPQAVFFTLPLALLAIGSELDPNIYEVVTIDARLDPDAEQAGLPPVPPALFLLVYPLPAGPTFVAPALFPA